MSQVTISGNASGTGVLTIASPNTNSNYTLTLPTVTGTVMVQTATGANLTTGSKYQVSGVTTNALAWVNFNGTSGSTAARASYNVSSVTRNGTGDYTITYTNALSDANYSWSFGGDQSGARLNTYAVAKTGSAVPSTAAIRVQFFDDQSTSVDTVYACVQIHGN